MRALPFCLAVCCLELGGPAGAAFAAPRSGRAKDLTPAELIRVDVSVVRPDGTRVVDLTREDFSVVEGGRLQRTIGFEVQSGDEVAGAKPAGPGLEALGEASRCYVVFAIDDLHITAETLAPVREALTRFVATRMRPREQIGVIVTSGDSGMIQEFSSDPEVLRASVARVSARGFPGSWDPQEELDVFDRDEQLARMLAAEEALADQASAALMRRLTQPEPRLSRSVPEIAPRSARAALETLESTMRSLAALPGRKVMVLFSDGIVAGAGGTGGFDLRRIADASTRGRVVLHVVDSQGLAAGTPQGASSSSLAQMSAEVEASARRRTARDGMRELAQMTGGTLLDVSQQLDVALDGLVRSSQGYYTLTYESRERKRDGGFRSLDVELTRDELVARTQAGFYDVEGGRVPGRQGIGDLARNPASEIRQALVSLFPRGELATRLAASFLSLGERGPQLVINGHVDLSTLRFERQREHYVGSLVVAMIAHDASGVPVRALDLKRTRLELVPEDYERALREGLKYFEVLSVPPGAYEVRFAAREDADGRLGSASGRIVIPDLASGELTLSDLFLLRESREGPIGTRVGVLLDDVQALPRYPREGRLYYQVQALNAARDHGGATQLTIEVRVLGEGGPIASTNETPFEVAETGLVPFAYTGRIRLEALSPGEYELAVTVRDRLAKSRAERRARFAIVVDPGTSDAPCYSPDPGE